jgi:fumarylacetoacetate (FAA) hydrolase
MKFATYANETADGSLMVVSADLKSAVPAVAISPTLRAAVEHWDSVVTKLQALSDALNSGAATGAEPFDSSRCMAPMPRGPQWLDASAFLNHGRLMEQAFKTTPIDDFDTVPLMYQGASDDFLGPHVTVELPSEEHFIDFEGEFGVVVDNVPMGTNPTEAMKHIRLVVMLNDWSLRGFGPREMKAGFGFLQAKPSTAFAPIAVTPDELGSGWRDGRVQMRLRVEYNGQLFGEPHGGQMNFHFGELIAHAARTRRLSAGAIVGSGTVSNASREAGSSCIAERRVIEIIDQGKASTPFMRSGDRVTMRAMLDDGTQGPFGDIDQQVFVRG